MLDESGDDLYVRQTVEDFGLGFDPVARLQYADNPEFSLSQSQNFSTNSLTRPLNEYQDVFVGQGVANAHNDLAVGGLSPTTVLPDANFFDGVARTLPAGLTADEAFHILPGTLQGNRDFGGSFIRIINGNGVPESMSVATLNLLDEQDLTVDGDIPLVFSQGGNSGTTSITLGFGGDENVTVSGEVNLFTGRVTLDLDPATSPPADAPYSTNFFFDYGSPVIAAEASTFTLASGFTLDAGLIVDLPSVDSTIAINSPVAIPTRDAGDIGLVDLRATNVLVNAPMAADQGFRVVQSRFLNEASVEASPVADVVTSNIVTIATPATPVEVGAQVLTPTDEVIPPGTNVIAVNVVGLNTELTLSNSVSVSQFRNLFFYNPSSSQTADVTLAAATESSSFTLDPLAIPANFDIQPGAVVLDTATGLVPPNTFVAAVDTITGRIDLTQSVALPAGTTALEFFNPGLDPTTVENFAATAAIQSNDFVFEIANDISSDVRDRGRLYIASSSSLTNVGGGNASLLAVNTSMADIVFEGQVSATTQSYFFETTVAETPYTFTTKNSSGQPSGSINATTMAVMLSNTTEADPANSVVQVVDIDTAVTSLRLSAGYDEQLNPPYVDDEPIGPFPFAVTVREADALSLDAQISSGGPVDFTVGGDLALTATIQSHSDLSFTSSGTMTGTAWLTTADGSIDISATDINISGLTQVLNAPFDGFSTDVSITASNGSVSLGQGIRAVNKIIIDQQSTTGSVQSNGIISSRRTGVCRRGRRHRYVSSVCRCVCCFDRSTVLRLILHGRSRLILVETVGSASALPEALRMCLRRVWTTIMERQVT